jgi:uncharacterized protein YlxW (UPF0749 family)
MKKILWTVLIAFTLSALPIGGTAFAGQAKQGKHTVAKAAKTAKQLKHAKRANKLANKLAKKLHKQTKLAKAGKLAHKKAKA